MRPVLPFVAPGGDRPHRVEVVGDLRLEADGRSRSEPFECRITLSPGMGTASILTLRSASARDVIDLDLQGTVQRGGVLVVTVSLRIHHPPDDDGDRVDAETTVVPAGSSPGFQLVCFDDDGCRVSAQGSITHEGHASG